MKKWILVCLSCLFFSFTTSAWADSDQDAAKAVIENWWAAMKSNDTDKAASYLAPQFVSIHTDGIIRNKADEATLIKNMHMKSYHLSDFQFSESGDVIVVTYKDKGEEKIDKKAIARKAAGRMAVLQKQDGNWLILAYANMDKIG